MAVLKAEEELAAGVDDDDRMYELVKVATGSEEKAAAALTARKALRLRRNEKPQQ